MCPKMTCHVLSRSKMLNFDSGLSLLLCTCASLVFGSRVCTCESDLDLAAEAHLGSHFGQGGVGGAEQSRFREAVRKKYQIIWK